MSLIANLTFVAILGSGLMAGTFFAFSSFVVGALRALPRNAGIEAMRTINVRAASSPFVVAFFGMTLLTAYLALYARLHDDQLGMPYLLIGSLLYFVGAFMVTGIGNVPLNVKLDAAPDDPIAWNLYVIRWTLWNHLRTAACVIALWAFTMSFMDQSHTMLSR